MPEDQKYLRFCLFDAEIDSDSKQLRQHYSFITRQESINGAVVGSEDCGRSQEDGGTAVGSVVFAVVKSLSRSGEMQMDMHVMIDMIDEHPKDDTNRQNNNKQVGSFLKYFKHILPHSTPLTF